ncbi:U32 family peptidase [Parendozoicomonas haliclonae]|uniref:Ubiquinone biosynthesis protein UbiV n=1 Tax=Parendozoicomonas haliclonae TaxID=1960125 RepID=A0A1X7AN17_9GAMM|nr:U32 family peptidase [Parendozoicomonas haliclonae]SMA49437.1 Peptidase family U32 [Parendozoicomonas haliclonae]
MTLQESASPSAALEVTLGPLLYFWPKETVQSFYRKVCDWPVDRVYLGETVCSKRRQMSLEDWMAIAESLSAAGKTVVLSTLTLLEAASDRSMLRKICSHGQYEVEANDMAAVQALSELGVNFTTGPQVNIYNAHTLKELVDAGLSRWVLPLELGEDDFSAILAQARELNIADRITTEVFVWGLMPLAASARCFTARAHDLPKDQCRFVCLDYPEGLPVYSQEQDRVFTLNGIQTLSGRCLDLTAQVERMVELGIKAVRVSPQPEGTLEVLEAIQARLNHQPAGALEHPAGRCQGYWYGMAGMIPLATV